MSGFDIILDTIGGSTSDMAIPLLKPFVGAKYLDLAWDLISDTDAHGIPVGAVKTGKLSDIYGLLFTKSWMEFYGNYLD